MVIPQKITTFAENRQKGEGFPFCLVIFMYNVERFDCLQPLEKMLKS